METFNGYFIAIAENVKRQSKNNFIKYDNNTMDSHTRFMEQAFTSPYPSMEWKFTTTEETEQIIKSLKTKNSYEYDETSTKILKISCPLMSSLINYICNKMMFWGVFPGRLKYATIIPLHKNEDRCELSNSRPV